MATSLPVVELEALHRLRPGKLVPARVEIIDGGIGDHDMLDAPMSARATRAIAWSVMALIVVVGVYVGFLRPDSVFERRELRERIWKHLGNGEFDAEQHGRLLVILDDNSFTAASME